jgi:hypothetical protein
LLHRSTHMFPVSRTLPFFLKQQPLSLASNVKPLLPHIVKMIFVPRTISDVHLNIDLSASIRQYFLIVAYKIIFGTTNGVMNKIVPVSCHVRRCTRVCEPHFRFRDSIEDTHECVTLDVFAPFFCLDSSSQYVPADDS